MTEEERRAMMQKNYASQLEGLGYGPDGMSLQMEATLHLNNPLTEEQRDYLLDVDFDDTPAVYFRTKHGKTVLFVKQQPNNGWISVKDRLPQRNEQGLVCDDGGKIAVAWHLGHNKWISPMLLGEIVYWMPLPEPPKEGEMG